MPTHATLPNDLDPRRSGPARSPAFRRKAPWKNQLNEKHATKRTNLPRSQYTGCRRCGELMPKVEEYSESATKKLLQTAGRLIGLLSVLPWDVMVEVLQQLRSGQVSQDRWQGRLRKLTSELKYFDPLGYNAVYWYTIEKIAEKLKSGELINPAIYVFNPDVVYDPQRRKKKPVGRQTGIPPPRK